MKKIISFALIFMLAITMSACSNGGTDSITNESQSANTSSVQSPSSDEAQNTENNSDTQETDNESDNTQNILVAYFSRTGENYGVGYIEKGNTHIVADMIAEQLGADTFEISTVTPYPESYDECTEIARQEQRENARPELATSVENMDAYDVIFLGYPNWWGDMPMAVYTFLESYDFSGKRIVPFCTHEGSGLASTEESIAQTCPDAEVLEGLAVRGSTAQNSQNDAKDSVINWLNKSGFIN